ncbi:outer membrane lipoprotein-sorting protein, partial [Candidatus Bipolaricaulota bacterium]
GDSFHGIMGLDIMLGGQTKTHKLEVWTLGEELALIRVLEPEIDLNSGYLQLGEDLWYYSPAVGSIKLPTIALGDALFGAGPSLEDLSHGTLSDDYDATVDIIDNEGASQYFLTLIPHPDAPVVYGKLEIWVSADFVMEKLVYYDQREAVVQTATFTDIVEMGDRKFATTITIEDAYGDQTVERIENPQFDLDLDAMFFSLDTFEAWGDD